MLKNYLDFVGRKYRNEAGADGADAGGAGGNEGVQTEDSGSLLTGGESSEAETSENKDSASGDSSGEDTGSGESQSDDAGNESSDTLPDTYADFTLPEGMELDSAALEQATPLFKELGLNQEQAQKVVSRYAELVQAGSQKQIDDFNQTLTDWGNQAKSDSEYGGENFDKNLKIAQSAVTKYGTPELKKVLDDFGVGNHPEMIRFMVRVGATLQEDVPGSQGGNVGTAQDRVTQMYGKQEG